MPKRPCLICGRLSDAGSYCADHRRPHRRTPSSKRTGTRAFNAKRAEVYLRDGGRCYLCGKQVDPNDFHVDHIRPVAQDGSDEMRNLALTHPACNMRKG